MYTVLLVDAERIIREGVREILTLSDLDLDIAAAASALEALQILDSRKIDIVLMDIRMPQMSGLELYDIIRSRWPMSKLIFLTGHLEFDYVYKVHRHARYVLKAEEDEKLVEAVREAIAEIENDLLMEKMSQEQVRHQAKALYYERMILLKELAEGSTDPSSVTQSQLDTMGANLDLSRPIYSMTIRCINMRSLPYHQQAQVGMRMSMLQQKFFLENWKGASFGYNKNITLLLLQPPADTPAQRCAAMLEGSAELYQKAVMKNLDQNVSIFIRREPGDFAETIGDFLPSTDVMMTMAEDEIRLGSLDTFSHSDTLPGQLQRELGRRAMELGHLYENQDRSGILLQLTAIRDRVRPLGNQEDLFLLELYTSLCSRTLSYAKNVGIRRESQLHSRVTGLFDLSRLGTWEEGFTDLLTITEQVFRSLESSLDSKNQDVVNQVKNYILTHLDSDTSLYALSRHVHLCPEHLLRLFKRKEGVTVLQYINDLKMIRARQMLTQTDMPIKDIATALGFTSTGYFGRFFKSKQGLTPNAYREQGGA